MLVLLETGEECRSIYLKAIDFYQGIYIDTDGDFYNIVKKAAQTFTCTGSG